MRDKTAQLSPLTEYKIKPLHMNIKEVNLEGSRSLDLNGNMFSSLIAFLLLLF